MVSPGCNPAFDRISSSTPGSDSANGPGAPDGGNTLEVTFRVEDPEAFNEPWSAAQP